MRHSGTECSTFVCEVLYCNNSDGDDGGDDDDDDDDDDGGGGGGGGGDAQNMWIYQLHEGEQNEKQEALPRNSTGLKFSARPNVQWQEWGTLSPIVGEWIGKAYMSIPGLM